MLLINIFIVAIFIFNINCRKDLIENNYAAADSSFYDVIIVGGGLSGLTCANYLKDKKILVLEKEENAGGRTISGEWEGFHYPKGTEYTGPPEEYMLKLYSELGVSTIEVPAPGDAIAYNGNIYQKENILDFLGSQSEKQNYYQLMNELASLAESGIEDAIWDNPEKLKNYSELDKLSVKEWLNQHSYSPLIQQYIDIENRGLFGASNNDLSMLFNISEMAYDLSDTADFASSEEFTFPEGMISLVKAFENILGNRIIKGATVTQVNTNSDMSVTVKYSKNGKVYLANATCVVMTTPAPVTASLVSTGLSPKVTKTLSQIKYSQYITLNLFTSERIWKDSWTISCLDNYFVTLYDAIRTQVSAEYSGKSILGVYIAPETANEQDFINQTDEEILNKTYSDLKNYFPDIQNKILGYDIQRFKYAFPVFDVNYNEKLQILLNDKSVKGPIFLGGDYMSYATVDGAFISAENAAEDVNDFFK